MKIEVGDIASSGGKIGEVFYIDDVTGRAVIRPFPLPGQEDAGLGTGFTASDDVKLVKKHWEWECEAKRGQAGTEELTALYEKWAQSQAERETATYRAFYEQQQAVDHSIER